MEGYCIECKDSVILNKSPVEDRGWKSECGRVAVLANAEATVVKKKTILCKER
jgi:hypothetical protein